MHKYLVGVVKDAPTEKSVAAKQNVHPVRRGRSTDQPKTGATILTPQLELGLFATCIVALVWYIKASHISFGLPGASLVHGGFSQGFLFATITCAAIAGMGLRYTSGIFSVGKDFASYPAHVPRAHVVHSTNRPSGTLIKSEYQKFKLIAKDMLAKDIYRLVFALPHKGSVLGLPIGQ